MKEFISRRDSDTRRIEVRILNETNHNILDSSFLSIIDSQGNKFDVRLHGGIPAGLKELYSIPSYSPAKTVSLHIHDDADGIYSDQCHIEDMSLFGIAEPEGFSIQLRLLE